MAVSAPTLVLVELAYIGDVRISFTDQSSGTAWHILERALDGTDDWVPITSTEEKSDNLLVDQNPQGLQSVGETYKYRVRADDGTEMSSPSSEVSPTITRNMRKIYSHFRRRAS